MVWIGPNRHAQGLPQVKTNSPRVCMGRCGWVVPSPAEPRAGQTGQAAPTPRRAARRPALSLSLPIAAAIRKRFHLHANPPITTTYLLSRGGHHCYIFSVALCFMVHASTSDNNKPTILPHTHSQNAIF